MDIIAVFETVGVGSIPTSPAKLYLCRSTDRIPCYERGDGGSIPSRGTNLIKEMFMTAEEYWKWIHDNVQ